jgi:flagellar biosynthetic protein FliS
MHGIAAYNRTVTQAPNEQILLMLLEQAIRNQNRAIEAMEEGNRSVWAAELHNCRAIFLELVGAIDADMAPEIARNLQQTYGWCLHHLQEATKTGNADTVRSVLRVTEILHSTWIQAVQRWYEEHSDSPTSLLER